MKISVIVPVYNVSKYIQKCVESILNQSYTNFELILIDDGSTDDSFDICQVFATKDTRVKAMRQSNAGPSKARNVGIRQAEGEYITFVDSDDFVSDSYLLNRRKRIERQMKFIPILPKEGEDINHNTVSGGIYRRK